MMNPREEDGEPTVAVVPGGIPARFRSGGYSSFLVVWAGQLVSWLGTGLSSFGLVVWLFQETKSATPYAIAFLTSSLPAILFAPIAGRFADRRDRRSVMLLADSADALVTLSIFMLVSTGTLRPWMVYILTFVSSACQAFQEPAWAAAVPTMVPAFRLDRANGLSGLSNALSTLLPPLLAGALFGILGLKGLLLVDFVTYFAALASLSLVRIPKVVPTEDRHGGSGFLSDAAFGFRYLARVPGLLGLMFFFSFVNFCFNFCMVLVGPMVMPVGGSAAFGAIQSIFGLGALLGGAVVAAFGAPNRGRVPFAVACIAVAAAGVLAAGLRPGLAWVGAGLFVMMFSTQIGGAAVAKIFQTKIEAGAQGRTQAARTIVARSLMPVAFLAAGPLVDRVFGPALMEGGALASTALGRVVGVGAGRGAGLLVAVSGAALLVATLSVALSPRIRHLEKAPDRL